MRVTTRPAVSALTTTSWGTNSGQNIDIEKRVGHNNSIIRTHLKPVCKISVLSHWGQK